MMLRCTHKISTRGECMARGMRLNRAQDILRDPTLRPHQDRNGHADRTITVVKVLVTFATMVRLENVHPLQAGILRLKHPSERRPGLPRERPWIFWPRFVWETLNKHAILVGMIGQLFLLKMAIARDPDAPAYTDQALTPVREDEDVTLDLLTKTTGARAAIAPVK